MAANQRYDVIIIGPGGAPLAYKLAPLGAV
jgi:hypothetical protein